jgi:hypothetical protein
MALPINLHSLNAVAKAQRLVSQINEDRGFLSDEDLNEIGPPGYGPRRKVEIAMLRKDEIIGSSVLTCVHPSLGFLPLSFCPFLSEYEQDLM